MTIPTESANANSRKGLRGTKTSNPKPHDGIGEQGGRTEPHLTLVPSEAKLIVLIGQSSAARDRGREAQPPRRGLPQLGIQARVRGEAR